MTKNFKNIAITTALGLLATTTHAHYASATAHDAHRAAPPRGPFAGQPPHAHAFDAEHRAGHDAHKLMHGADHAVHPHGPADASSHHGPAAATSHRHAGAALPPNGPAVHSKIPLGGDAPWPPGHAGHKHWMPVNAGGWHLSASAGPLIHAHAEAVRRAARSCAKYHWLLHHAAHHPGWAAASDPAAAADYAVMPGCDSSPGRGAGEHDEGQPGSPRFAGRTYNGDAERAGQCAASPASGDDDMAISDMTPDAQQQEPPMIMNDAAQAAAAAAADEEQQDAEAIMAAEFMDALADVLQQQQDEVVVEL